MTKKPQTQSAESVLQQPKSISHWAIPSVGSSFSDETFQVDTLPDAIEVARHLIALAAAEDEPEYLTHMRLQKLLYYVQGWSLAMRDRPMFSGRIEAWAHGPVIKEVYPYFADFGDRPIAPYSKPAKTLSRDDKKFILAVWNEYRGFSAGKLRDMTHNESPWKEARKGYAPADRCAVEITKEAMKRYFDRAAESG